MEDEVPPSISEYIVKFYARKKEEKRKGSQNIKKSWRTQKRNVLNSENLTKGASVRAF